MHFKFRIADETSVRRSESSAICLQIGLRKQRSRRDLFYRRKMPKLFSRWLCFTVFSCRFNRRVECRVERPTKLSFECVRELGVDGKSEFSRAHEFKNLFLIALAVAGRLCLSSNFFSTSEINCSITVCKIKYFFLLRFIYFLFLTLIQLVFLIVRL